MTFTDAVPTARAGRTYLPARAVLEALGATVTADSTTGTVTAVRGGKTLVMTIGSTQATVTEDGISNTLTMDAAPYVENSRTFVPVRFAAQSFACAVGWDGAKQTVVLVDAAKLAETAIANNRYTLLEKVAALSEKYSTGNWAMDGTMSMDASAMGTDKVMTASGTVKGVASGQTAMQMNMDMKMDMTGMAKLIASMTGKQPTAQELAAMKMNMGMDMRADMTTGKYYFKIAGLPAEAGIPKDAWLSMDMNALMAQAGMDLDMDTLLQSKTLDPADLVSLFLSQLKVDDSVASYGMCTILAQGAAGLFSDDAFTKTDTGYVNKIDHSLDGVTLNLTLTLTTNTKGDVTAYKMDGNLSGDLKAMAAQPRGESLQSSLDSMAAMGFNMDAISLGLNLSTDDKGVSTAKLSMMMGTVSTLNISATSKMTSTTKKPEVTPPAGATVVDYFELLNSMMPDQK